MTLGAWRSGYFIPVNKLMKFTPLILLVIGTQLNYPGLVTTSGGSTRNARGVPRWGSRSWTRLAVWSMAQDRDEAQSLRQGKAQEKATKRR